MTRRARDRDRGAIVFIVAMTLAVLASLGLFALISASSEVKTAGHERQNLQSHYLSETGVVAAALQITIYGDGMILPAMRLVNGTRIGDYDSASTTPRHQCWSLAAVNPSSTPAPDVHSQECKIMNFRTPSNFDLVSPFAAPFNGVGLMQLGGAPVLQPTTLDADVRVEITDPVGGATLYANAVDGQLQQSVRPCTVTVTTYGETLPTTTSSYGGAGLEVGRARITFLSYGNNCQ